MSILLVKFLVEVVGGAASITAIVTVSLQSVKLVYQIISGIRDGPPEVQQLLLRLSQLENLLQQVTRSSIDSTGTTQEFQVQLHSTVQECAKLSKTLESRLVSLCTKGGDGKTIKAWRFIKVLLSKDELSRIRMTVLEIYARLIHLVGVQNL